MIQHSSIPSAFPRAARAVHADSLYPGLAILVTLMVLLAGWLLWMVVFKIPFYATSQSARVTPDAMVVASFPGGALAQIQPGQMALFLPDTETSNLPSSSGTLVATVAEVDTRRGRVLLLLPDDPEAHSLLYPGLSGQVHVVVRKQSPLSLIVEAARMGASS